VKKKVILFLRVAICLILMSSTVNGCKQLPSRLKDGKAATSAAESKAQVSLKIVGVLEAYGNEPHVTWMIKTKDGTLYYPKGELQKQVSKIPTGTYEWEGTIGEPLSLAGLVPKHEAVFLTLGWKRVAE
jgi:hypothetical protein